VREIVTVGNVKFKVLPSFLAIRSVSCMFASPASTALAFSSGAP
jgi:hypothetical protein